MQPNQTIHQSQSAIVSLDILLDILKILMQYNISYQIISINENDNSLQMQFGFSQANDTHLKAKENITTIIDDYNFYLSGPQTH